MKETSIERPEGYELALAGEEYRGSVVKEMRQMINRFQDKEKEFNRAGFTIIYDACVRDGKREKDIFMLKGPDGYSVQVNGKTVVRAETRDDCAKQAYIAGYIGYYTRVEIGQGKAAAERAKKDPKIQKLIKNAGRAANAY